MDTRRHIQVLIKWNVLFFQQQHIACRACFAGLQLINVAVAAENCFQETFLKEIL